MSKINAEFIQEAQALGAIRGNCLSLQMALERGPKRTAEQRQNFWIDIAQTATACASAIQKSMAKAVEPKIEQLPGV